MLKVENRESAHLKSRVKDLSVVPNIVSYTGLFACITPLSKVPPADSVNNIYEPILIRDTDSLIANFGDPRIDPDKYVDLYSIMQLVSGGNSCYVCKVNSGTTGKYRVSLCNEVSESAFATTDRIVWTIDNLPHDFEVVSLSYSDGAGSPTIEKLTYKAEPSTNGEYKYAFADDTIHDGKRKLIVTLGAALAPAPCTLTQLIIYDHSDDLNLIAYSSTSESISLEAKVVQVKPYSLKAFYLVVDVMNGDNKLASAKIKLEPTTTNQGLVDSLNSLLSTYFSFAISDESHPDACEIKESGKYSIICTLLDKIAPKSDGVRADIAGGTYNIPNPQIELAAPLFEVNLSDYENAYNQYKDKKYAGCLMSDLTAPLHHFYGDHLPANVPFGYPTPFERRSLHYYLKQVACERKDTTVILSTPYEKNDSGVDGATRYNVTGTFSIDNACDWVASQNDYPTLWEYGQTNTTDYSEQSFYLEIYYSWLNLRCTKIVNGTPSSVVVKSAPSNVVINNVLSSFRERGPQYPVAGDQSGTLPDYCSVLSNPKTKLERDQLVQYRINPIYDTGTRGVQIYGNETLNAGYTDLNAAHIARTLVNVRSRIDEYTETLKFSINSVILWDTWKNYVTSMILEPLKSANALSSYSVAMGNDTTSAAEIANRRINGIVELTFYQSAEIFSLDFVVYSSATAFE